jgi:hypothetical protein
MSVRGKVSPCHIRARSLGLIPGELDLDGWTRWSPLGFSTVLLSFPFLWSVAWDGDTKSSDREEAHWVSCPEEDRN